MLSTDKQTDKQTDRQTDRHTDRQTNQRYQKHNLRCQGGKNGSLPAPRSGYANAIMVFFGSFTHLRILRSPPKFNQFFIVLPRTPP